MPYIDEASSESVEENLKRVAREQTMSLEEVLIVCQHLGIQLHGIPEEYRQLTISKILEQASVLIKQDDKYGALMFLTVAASSEYVGQDTDALSDTMQKLLADLPKT